MIESPFKVLSFVADLFERQGIKYVLVGSFASSMHGVYRATADIDILADIKTQHVVPLLDAFKGTFYVDENNLRDAITRQQSFNVIHFDSVFKVDIFIPKSDEFAKNQLARGELRRITPNSEQMIYVATAEDTILAKLRRYESGGRVSNSQWTDVVGIIGAASTRLDAEYLDKWASILNLRDLLDKALAEARSEGSG